MAGEAVSGQKHARPPVGRYAIRRHRPDGSGDMRCHAGGDGAEVTGREVVTGGDSGLPTSGDERYWDVQGRMG